MSKRMIFLVALVAVTAVLIRPNLGIWMVEPRPSVAKVAATEDEVVRADIHRHCADSVPARAELSVKVTLVCDWADSNGARVAHHELHRALTQDDATLKEDVVSTTGRRRIVGMRWLEDGHARKIVQLIDPLGPDTYRVRLMQGEWPDQADTAPEAAFDAFVLALVPK